MIPKQEFCKVCGKYPKNRIKIWRLRETRSYCNNECLTRDLLDFCYICGNKIKRKNKITYYTDKINRAFCSEKCLLAFLREKYK